MLISSGGWRLVAFLIAVGLGLAPTAAHSQAPDPFMKTLGILKKDHGSCVLQIKSAGTISAGSDTIVLWVYSYEGCNGGNNWGASTDAFYLKESPRGPALVSKIALSKSMVEQTSFSSVDNVSFKTSATAPTSYVEIDGVSLGGGDARCCPTAGRQVRLWFENGQIKSTIVKTWTATK